MDPDRQLHSNPVLYKTDAQFGALLHPVKVRKDRFPCPDSNCVNGSKGDCKEREEVKGTNW